MTGAGLAKGLAALGVAFDREVTGDVLAIYSDALSGQFASDESWLERVAEVIRTEERFPPPAVLLRGRVASVKEGDAEAEIEAGTLFTRIVSQDGLRTLGRYSAETGQRYDRSLIEARVGEAAAVAFEAAGGNAVFMSTDDGVLSFARAAFVKAYLASNRADRRQMLTAKPIDALEARTLHAQIEQRVKR